MKSILKKPILLLITFNIIVGLFIFRDYGLTWDEPLFYSYGDALGYAYSPTEWFSGDFNLYNSYGSSREDHKTHGPAYLLLARNFVYGIRALGADEASAWHLVNFLFFQLGIYFIYRISKRWMSSSASFFTTVLFSFQPLIWGHAFINPKDPPFLTFFLAALCLGFEMVDSLESNASDKTKRILIAAIALGIASSIRVLAPLAGLLVFLYFLFGTDASKRPYGWRSFFQYGFITVVVMFMTWPFLWENPARNFIDMFILMSSYPTKMAVLFGGTVYSAQELPRRYLPVLLSLNLTEPIWPLFGLGFLVGYWKLIKARASDFRKQIVSISLVLVWFLLVFTYVIVQKPVMYDGMRHFIFILPPIFIFIGFAFDVISEKLSRIPVHRSVSSALLSFLLILPGVIGIVKLHPYQYAYYNSFIGGTDGAFRTYETDFWLTCYKEAAQEINKRATPSSKVLVLREAYIAATYFDPSIEVRDLRGDYGLISPGDYILVSSRTNEDQSIFTDQPVVMRIKRGDATFCTIRQIR